VIFSRGVGTAQPQEAVVLYAVHQMKAAGMLHATKASRKVNTAYRIPRHVTDNDVKPISGARDVLGDRLRERSRHPLTR